ncbi:MAG TPA: histidine phosphatase family protein [Planctomycetaceae bacterium]|nr:histidine phosphatase family protein [Planctomycetaceae bacterium]
MKTLLLLRHAKSSWKDSALADHDRPLNQRGKRDAPRVGRLLAELGLVPDLIVSSTARRARKTAEKVAEESGYVGAIDAVAALYPGEPQAIARAIRSRPEDAARLLVVGHNPGLEDFLAAVIGCFERLPTAALAHVELEIDRWQDFTPAAGGRLVRLWTPDELPAAELPAAEPAETDEA